MGRAAEAGAGAGRQPHELTRPPVRVRVGGDDADLPAADCGTAWESQSRFRSGPRADLGLSTNAEPTGGDDAGAELILLNSLVDDAQQLERLAAEVIPELL
jgi:hypothetical protein